MRHKVFPILTSLSIVAVVLSCGLTISAERKGGGGGGGSRPALGPSGGHFSRPAAPPAKHEAAVRPSLSHAGGESKFKPAAGVRPSLGLPERTAENRKPAPRPDVSQRPARPIEHDRPSLGNLHRPQERPAVRPSPRKSIGRITGCVLITPSNDRPTARTVPSIDQTIARTVPSIDRPIARTVPSIDQPIARTIPSIDP